MPFITFSFFSPVSTRFLHGGYNCAIWKMSSHSSFNISFHCRYLNGPNASLYKFYCLLYVCFLSLHHFSFFRSSFFRLWQKGIPFHTILLTFLSIVSNTEKYHSFISFFFLHHLDSFHTHFSYRYTYIQWNFLFLCEFDAHECRNSHCFLSIKVSTLLICRCQT